MRLSRALGASLCALLIAMPAMAQPITYTGRDPNTGARLATPGIQADTTSFANMTTATTVKIVTGQAGLQTYFTQVRFHAGGTTTGKLVTGTGTNCGTNTTDLTETLDLTASDGMVMGVGIGPVVIAGAGLDVCAVNGQAVNLRIGWAEAQF